MMVRRDLEPTLKRFSKFPVVIIQGPRQSGKTTLAEHFFKNHTYINLEDPKNLDFVLHDPERFLREYENEYGIMMNFSMPLNFCLMFK
jgi:uncharacterized protein